MYQRLPMPKEKTRQLPPLPKTNRTHDTLFLRFGHSGWSLYLRSSAGSSGTRDIDHDLLLLARARCLSLPSRRLGGWAVTLSLGSRRSRSSRRLTVSKPHRSLWSFRFFFHGDLFHLSRSRLGANRGAAAQHQGRQRHVRHLVFDCVRGCHTSPPLVEHGRCFLGLVPSHCLILFLHLGVHFVVKLPLQAGSVAPLVLSAPTWLHCHLGPTMWAFFGSSLRWSSRRFWRPGRVCTPSRTCAASALVWCRASAPPAAMRSPMPSVLSFALPSLLPPQVPLRVRMAWVPVVSPGSGTSAMFRVGTLATPFFRARPGRLCRFRDGFLRGRVLSGRTWLLARHGEGRPDALAAARHGDLQNNSDMNARMKVHLV